MTYEEVQPGQRVKIVVPGRKHQATGTVKAKSDEPVLGTARERVYIDTDAPRGRKVVAPSVLELLG